MIKLNKEEHIKSIKKQNILCNITRLIAAAAFGYTVGDIYTIGQAAGVHFSSACIVLFCAYGVLMLTENIQLTQAHALLKYASDCVQRLTHEKISMHYILVQLEKEIKELKKS